MSVYTKAEINSVQSLAGQLDKALIQDERNDGSKFYHLVDGAPQWMTDVIYEAHGDKLPDDTVYNFVGRAAEALANAEDYPEDAISEIEPDIYTSDLTSWLAARNDHVEYITEAISEFGSQFTDGTALLQIAQKLQIEEVGFALLHALEGIEPNVSVEDFDPADNDYVAEGDTNTYSRE
jgi:hypothetical protein